MQTKRKIINTELLKRVNLTMKVSVSDFYHRGTNNTQTIPHLIPVATVVSMYDLTAIENLETQKNNKKSGKVVGDNRKPGQPKCASSHPHILRWGNQMTN